MNWGSETLVLGRWGSAMVDPMVSDSKAGALSSICIVFILHWVYESTEALKKNMDVWAMLSEILHICHLGIGRFKELQVIVMCGQGRRPIMPLCSLMLAEKSIVWRESSVGKNVQQVSWDETFPLKQMLQNTYLQVKHFAPGLQQ